MNDFSYFHACPVCFPKLGDKDLIAGGRRVVDVREQNAEKCQAIREEMDLEVYWEHE